jgi:hypothetical protein
MFGKFGAVSVAQRRGVPIHGYVGPNGSGKTLAMVNDTLPTLAAGRRVLSTLRLSDPATGELHPLCDVLTSWRQLLDAEDCDVLLDEIQGVASSRTYAALPAQLATILCQLRKRNVCLRWTSPNWARADVIMREVTSAVTVSRAFLPQKVEGSLWPSRRLFWWRTYDAADWEDFSMKKVEAARSLCSSFYWRPGKPAENFYTTLEQVATLDHITDVGLCITCGGTRARPKCDCAREPVKGRSLEPTASGVARHLASHPLSLKLPSLQNEVAWDGSPVFEAVEVLDSP